MRLSDMNGFCFSLFFFLDEKEPKNQENLTLPSAPAALPAKFSSQRTMLHKRLFWNEALIFLISAIS
jgi:hypothetical protein